MDGTDPSNDEASARSDDGPATVPGLSLGASGSSVSELQAYLKGYGYFRNDDLSARHPGWRPITNETPEDGVYDKATEAAVRELQRRNGIEPTGIAGPETHALVDAPRCGNPDSLELDPDSKFALFPQKWPASKRNFTWKAIDPATCRKWNGSAWVACSQLASLSQLRTIASTALFLWSMETDVTFTETTGTTDITFQVSEIHQRGSAGPSGSSSISGSPNDLAITVGTFVTSTNQMVSAGIHFNQAHPITPVNTQTNPTPTTHFDMLAIALHEVGHALTLDHSNVGTTPVMEPAIGTGPNQPRSLRPDDAVAISARFDRWNTRPGLANDLAVGADGSVWHIGTAGVPGGSRIYRWFPPTLGSVGGWQEASGGGGAVRVGVLPNGTPWVVNDIGDVFWHSANHNEGGWAHIPNICARDIGVGGNGAIWFVTCTPDNQGSGGGFKVGKLAILAVTPDIWQLGVQEAAGEAHALRIAVDSGGTPWIVNAQNDVQMRRSTDPTVAGWGTRAGIKASDITVTPTEDGTPFATGTAANPGIFVWNDQAELSHVQVNGPCDTRQFRDCQRGTVVVTAPKRAAWIPLPALPSGTPSLVAAGPRTVWLTNTSKAIFENTAKSLF